MQTKGFISYIGLTEQVSEKFSKRDVVIEIEEFNQSTGNSYNHFEAFQVINNNTAVLENFKVGDEVTINFNIKSNRVDKDGTTRFFTNLTAYKIDKVGEQQVATYTHPQQNYPSQNQSSVPGLNNPNEASDDLPF